MNQTEASERGSGLPQGGRPFPNLIFCRWDPAFSTRRHLMYSIENKPHIEARADLKAQHDVETGAELGKEESVIREFMRGPDESDVCLPKADKVEAFCFGANLEMLKSEKGEAGQALIAWLDDRSLTEGELKGRARTNHGPLTARDLYRELKKPVRQGPFTTLQKAIEAHDPTIALLL
jgi:hypothetical protein